MPSKKDNNQNMKSDKILYIIYPNMESSIKKVDGCKNNSENLQQKNR